jgi:hypothetical protein
MATLRPIEEALDAIVQGIEKRPRGASSSANIMNMWPCRYEGAVALRRDEPLGFEEVA